LNPLGNKSLINCEYYLIYFNVIRLNHAATKKNDSCLKYLPSEQVGPVNEVTSQSHAYEFHCCTHIPRLAQILWLHFVLGPGKMRITNSMEVFTLSYQWAWYYFYVPSIFTVVYHEREFLINYNETKLRNESCI
jgi:hypothetical protein